MPVSKAIARPVDGRRVRDPRTGAVLEGELVVDVNAFWFRREAAGDVTLERIPEEEPEAPAPPVEE